MEKVADILILKRFCPIDGPFEKPPKIQPTGSGGHNAQHVLQNSSQAIELRHVFQLAFRYRVMARSTVIMVYHYY